MSPITEPPVSFDKNAAFSANVTFRVDFPVPIGESATNRGIGKGDKKADDVDEMNNQYIGLSDDMVDKNSMATKKDLNLISRSVASSNLSQALGLGSVVAESYAKAPDGSNIGVSAMASGTQMMTNVVDQNGLPLETITRDFDFARPEIQKGLYNLEAVDYLTGQIDRHSGNIFINDETGQVEGIDNDLCFGEKSLSVATRDGEIGAKAVGAPPLFYHQDTAAAIEKMTPEKLGQIIKGAQAPGGGNQLSGGEITAAQKRLETMKASIQLARAEGRVVAQFDANTFQASVQHQNTNAGEALRGKHSGTGNYVGRSHNELQYAKEQSLKPNTADRIESPGAPRPLNDYEKQLAAHQTAAKQAAAGVLANPSPELGQALGQKAAIQDQIAALNSTLDTQLQEKGSLEMKRTENQRAAEALVGNKADLQACMRSFDENPESLALTEPQVKLLRNMVPNIGDVQAGERLSREQRTALDGTLKKLNSMVLADARMKETEAQSAFVNSALPEVQAQKAALLKELTEVENNIDNLVQATPAVQQAVQQQQQFVAEQKAQFQFDPKVARLEQLAKSTAESNGLPVESLNLTRGGKMQTPAQLRSSAINNRDDAGASKLAGDQMAGTVDHASLNESEQAAIEGTLQQLGRGSDLEVAKMYARADELNAMADVQVKFGEISKAINEGVEPTQEQVESFGAAVQALSDSTQKSQRATQAVSESIENRIQKGLEAKVGPILDQKGYSPQEKAATIDALTSAAVDIDIMKLRDTDERADLYVDQMAQGIEESSFEYPGGNKVHEAVYRAFDATATPVPDGTTAVKPAGGGQTFNEKRANQHVQDALEKNGMPVPELPQGIEREQGLIPQIQAGQERVEIYNSKVQLDAQKTAETRDLKDHLQKLEERKEKLSNAGAGDKLKAILKHGPKGIAGEVAKLDKEIAATQKALEAVKKGTGLDQHQADIHKMKGDLAAGKQELGDAKKDLKKAEKTIAAVERKADLNDSVQEMGMGKTMSAGERDNLVREANKAINVREALKPKVDAQKQLGKDIKQGEKAVQVRQAIGGHRTSSGGGGGKSHGV